jgi:hypothetical protein
MFSLAPHLDCDSDEARVARAIAATSLVIWGAGFPIALGLLINRKASDPQYSFVIVSFGYKSALRHWEAWECMKKFMILLIITFLNDASLFSPELAVIVLLLFLCFTIVVAAVYEPFQSSLVNKAHLACEFLFILVLLSGLLSTATGRMWPGAAAGEVEAMSIAVVSYMACVLAALVAILVVEVGSTLCPGGALHAVWDSFVEGNHAATVAQAAQRLSSNAVRRLSNRANEFRGSFSVAIAPTPATSIAEEDIMLSSSSAAADGASASPGLPSLSNNTMLKEQYVALLQRMRGDIVSLASMALLLDADNDDRQQLETCGLKLEMLAERAEAEALRE